MGEHELKETRILVVDDDKELADMLAGYLKRTGYSTSAVYNAPDALSAFQSDPFPIVITDLKMPGMTGIELLEAIKSINDLTTVIVITGYGTIDTAVTAIKKGAYDFITKPFDLKELDLLIHRANEKFLLSTRTLKARRNCLFLMASLPFWFLLGFLAMKLMK